MRSDRHGDTGAVRPTILLDCDPGHDDALAIVAAARWTDLVGITTVAGNASLDHTTHNALVMRDLLRIDVPIHAGAGRPLVAEPKFAGYVHGESGLEGADLPAPTTPLDGTDATTFIIEMCRAHDELWLVPTGPMTNIAMALRRAPDIVERVAGVSFMGGGSYGNRSATAEFNIWADPEAARIVVRSGIDLVMSGLDVTHRFLATDERIESVRRLDGRLAAVLGDLMEYFSAAYGRLHEPGSLTGAAMHDPLAVLALTHADLFTGEHRHVDVEVSGELTRGMTVIDRRRLLDRPASNCRVLVDVDADGAFGLLLDAIARFSTPESTL